MRVLIVHNDPSILGQLEACVAATSFVVLTAHNPITALDLLDAHPMDVVITRVDFGPGTLNGVAFARMVRHKGLRVVFVVSRDWHDLIDDLGDVVRLPLDATGEDRLIMALKRLNAPGNSPDDVLGATLPGS